MPITEANDSISPNTAGFSPEGGRAEWLFYCRGDQIRDECLAMLGWVEPAGDGTLHRVLPKVHPQYPWLVATTINIRGQGRKTEDDTLDEFGDPTGDPILAENVPTDADMELLPAATEEYLRYVMYDLQVTFESVPYNLYPDSDVTMVASSWYPDDDDGVGEGTTPFSYAKEHLRFIDWPRFPATEFLQFRHGQMRFETTSGLPPDTAPFAGLVRVPMRKQILKAMWSRVPESYVTHADSYLDRFLWRVNQNEVTWNGEVYAPGHLLYAGYSFPRRNNPPFPDEDPFFPGFYTTLKILDIELTFMVCRYHDADAPTPLCRNFIAAGHNLEIAAVDRRPHYVRNIHATDALKQYPKYLSCPMELIFTDPAFEQDIGVLRQ